MIQLPSKNLSKLEFTAFSKTCDKIGTNSMDLKSLTVSTFSFFGNGLTVTVFQRMDNCSLPSDLFIIAVITLVIVKEVPSNRKNCTDVAILHQGCDIIEKKNYQGDPTASIVRTRRDSFWMF